VLGTAVFGAGISGEAPASLPPGFGLRDDLLRLMRTAARERLGSMVTDGSMRTCWVLGERARVVWAACIVRCEQRAAQGRSQPLQICVPESEGNRL
jgi:hypothetical protein